MLQIERKRRMPNRNSAGFQLRPLETEDLATAAGWLQNIADMARFDRSTRVPLNAAGLEQAWELFGDTKPNASKCWFALTTDSGQLCGITGLESISAVNRDAVAAMFIEESRRGRGVGIRALALLLDFAFRQIGLNRVTSYYRADNTRSEQMTARAGFATEGRMRAAWFAEGRFFDMITVGLLREEWGASREALAQELGASPRVSFRGAEAAGWAWPPGPAAPPDG
ncbi:GNAT family N-acetyltransferase [Leisingera aquaemixtae]|uniref:GNAT family N-acetyltransferase n=1 Tax=Leisingera aquaemixtae TaxID=1396826 RepID=UPI0021A7903B|nr:GNAT family protein [Leisingera aquaemixtae]